MLATHRCLTFGNEVAGQWTRQQLIAMDEKFCRAMGVPSRWVRGAAQPEMKSAAAAHAVAPHLQELERQNAELRNHLAREVRRNLDQRLAEAVPNFREIDRDPRWLQWLIGRDALSGQIRQQLLDDAVAKGNAGHVIAFFRGFLQEAAAGRHGQPGQAAGGKPIYTRAQITQMG